MVPPSHSSTANHPDRWVQALLWLAAGAGLVWRLMHLNGHPWWHQLWRQADSWYYTWHFYHHGVSLMQPQVSWAAGQPILFEFPLPHAVAALIWHLLPGEPQWWFIQLTSLAYMMMATAGLFAWMKRLLPGAAKTLPLLVTVLFWLSPLSIYYSLAPTADSFALAAAFWSAALLEQWREREKEELVAYSGGWLLLLIAVMVKAPVTLPVGAVLVVRLWPQRGRWQKRWPWLLAPAVVIGLAYIFWMRHIVHVNSQLPPHLLGHTYADPALWQQWYVGSWQQRLDPNLWQRMALSYLSPLVLPIWLVVPAAGGMLLAWRSGWGRITAALLLGSTAYVLVFFNLLAIHDYYWLALTPLFCWGLALALNGVRGWWQLGALGLVLLVTGRNLQATGLHWHWHTPTAALQEAAAMERATAAGDKVLIITADSTAWASPVLLGLANRQGLNLPPRLWQPEVVNKLSRQYDIRKAWVQQGDSAGAQLLRASGWRQGAVWVRD